MSRGVGKRVAGALAIGLLAAAAISSSAQAHHRHGHRAHHAKAPAPPACDRDCLTGIAHRYMDAMAAHQPQGLPWAETVKYAENAVPMDIGDGLWGTISAHEAPVLEAADPSTGQVAWFGVVEEHGQPAFYALRLKVEAGKIAEAEAIVRRKGGPPQYGDPTTYAPDPAFAATAGGHGGRKAQTTAVDRYFSALAGAGKPVAPLDPDCSRLDNGVLTSSGSSAEGGVQGCRAQLAAHVFAPIHGVRARRYPIVDEKRGVVIAAGFLDLPATAPKPSAGLTWAADYPYSIAYLAAFKLEHGQITRIQSISDALPYLMPSPWGGD